MDANLHCRGNRRPVAVGGREAVSARGESEYRGARTAPVCGVRAAGPRAGGGGRPSCRAAAPLRRGGRRHGEHARTRLRDHFPERVLWRGALARPSGSSGRGFLGRQRRGRRARPCRGRAGHGHRGLDLDPGQSVRGRRVPSQHRTLADRGHRRPVVDAGRPRGLRAVGAAPRRARPGDARRSDGRGRFAAADRSARGTGPRAAPQYASGGRFGLGRARGHCRAGAGDAFGGVGADPCGGYADRLLGSPCGCSATSPPGPWA